jgi:hypothetical protein
MSHTVSKKTVSGRCMVAVKIDFVGLEDAEIRRELAEVTQLLRDAIANNALVLEMGTELGAMKARGFES